MYQVLLVDDEALARNDVKSMLDWEKHGFALCGEASNGVMALSMMERHTPQIAILDVSMPVMNGVELCSAIRERFPKVKTVMLSSFDDYDYVRACLKVGAMDYVLKHRLDGASLLSLLRKAAKEWEEEEKRDEARSAQSQMLERLSPVIHREVVANLARDAREAGLALDRHARDNGLYAQALIYAAAAVQIVPFALLTDAFTDIQKQRFVIQAADVMQMAVGEIERRTVAYVGEGRFIVLFSAVDRSEGAASAQIRQAMSSLVHSAEKFLNIRCLFAVGPLCGSLQQVGHSYEKASEEMDELLHQGGSDLPSQGEGLYIEEQKRLLLSVERLDRERIGGIFSSMFAPVRTHPVYSVKVQRLAIEQLRLMEMLLRRHLPHGGGELLPSRIEMSRWGSVAELEQCLASHYARLAEEIKKQQASSRYSGHISKAVQLILEKYASNLSLDVAASALSLHPSYLSRLFKEETGMTFTEYLNRVRIKTSCALMDAGHECLREISSQVGFLNHTYFFKVFKTMTGMTPHAYMEQRRLSNP